MLESTRAVFELFVQWCVLLLEVITVCIILFVTIKSLINFIKKNEFYLYLLKGLSLSLTFAMSAEILKTVILEDKSELLILAATIGLRGIMSLLLYWEMKNHEI